MMRNTFIQDIEDTARALLKKAGYLLLNVDFIPSKEPVIRLVIYKKEGISLSDCERATEILSRQMDDFFPARYHLEVSSPGLNRELKSFEEYELFKGRMAKLHLRSPWAGQDILEGVLEGLKEQLILLRVGEEIYSIPREIVQKAQLIFRWKEVRPSV